MCLFRPNFAYMTTVTVDLCYARPTSTGAELNSHVMGESIFKMGYYLGLKYVTSKCNHTEPPQYIYCLRTWWDGFLWDDFFPDLINLFGTIPGFASCCE